jgi:predicted ArsR family transcriptional regulator
MDLVCQANLALMQGLASGLQIKGVEALLEREPGRCCVVFERVPRTQPAGDASIRG